MKKLKEKYLMQYTCPFCKKEIVSSKKTEVYYRNHWINGCYECFGLSISSSTIAHFQEKNI